METTTCPASTANIARLAGATEAETSTVLHIFWMRTGRREAARLAGLTGIPTSTVLSIMRASDQAHYEAANQ